MAAAWIFPVTSIIVLIHSCLADGEFADVSQHCESPPEDKQGVDDYLKKLHTQQRETTKKKLHRLMGYCITQCAVGSDSDSDCVKNDGTSGNAKNLRPVRVSFGKNKNARWDENLVGSFCRDICEKAGKRCEFRKSLFASSPQPPEESKARTATEGTVDPTSVEKHGVTVEEQEDQNPDETSNSVGTDGNRDIEKQEEHTVDPKRLEKHGVTGEEQEDRNPDKTSNSAGTDGSRGIEEQEEQEENLTSVCFKKLWVFQCLKKLCLRACGHLGLCHL